MEKYELQKLRGLPIEEVAERLGLRVVRHKALCPFHDDHHASLSFKVSKNTFRCFVCDAKGGTIDLVMRFLNKDFREACRWLADEHNIILDEWKCTPALGPKGRFACEEPTPLCTFDATRYERFFERPWLSPEARRFLFEERRLDPRVVRWCRLTSWKDREGVPWLQIPYYDREGKLVGVQNRNLIKGASPRFRFPQGSQCGIYNLPVLNLLKPGDELYIAEGASDCWSLLSAGHKTIAIPSATLLSKKDIELLSSLNSSPKQGRPGGVTFHMYPDRDAPGERLFLQLQKVLPSLVHHQLPPGCKDYSEYYLKKLRVKS
jgi:DNA primase